MKLDHNSSRSLLRLYFYKDETEYYNLASLVQSVGSSQILLLITKTKLYSKLLQKMYIYVKIKIRYLFYYLEKISEMFKCRCE